MKKLITLDEQITEVKMAKEKYIFLEGQTDFKFWNSLLNGHNEIYYLIDMSMVENNEQSNKNAVINLMKKLNVENHSSFGVVDLDYDSFIVSGTSDYKIEEDNIYYYAANSLESFLLYSMEFEKVINLVCTHISCRSIEDFRNKVVNISRIKGKIRLINDKKIIGRQLTCKKLKIKKCITKTKEAEEEAKVVKSLQGSWELTQEEMNIILNKLRHYDSIEESIFLCHGHDVFQVLEELIGSNVAPTTDNQRYTEDQLFKYFIAYYESKAKNKNLPEDLIGSLLMDKIPVIEIA